MITKQQLRDFILEGYQNNKLKAHNYDTCLYHTPDGHYCVWGYVFHKLGVPDYALDDLNYDGRTGDPIGIRAALNRLQDEGLVDRYIDIDDHEAQLLQYLHDDWAMGGIPDGQFLKALKVHLQ